MSTTYRVDAEYKVGTKGAASALDDLTSKFSMLNTLAAGFGVSLGIGALVSKLVELNSHLETTRITLATMFQAGGLGGLTDSAEDFRKSMGMSSLIIQTMKRDARELPGTFDDLMAVFKGTLAGGRGAGKSINEIEHLAAGMMSVGATLGTASDVTARDMGMLFQGRLGSHNSLWMQLQRYLKNGKGEQLGAEGFKALDDVGKWDALTRAVGKFQHGIDEVGHSWEAVSSTSKDYAEQLYVLATSKVFSFMESKLAEWNKYYEDNKVYIDAMVTAFGTDLVNAVSKGFGVMKDVFSFIADHKDALIAVAEAYAAVKLFSAATGIVGAGMSMAKFAGTGLAIGAGMGGGGAAGLAASAGASALAFATSPVVLATIAAAVIAYGGYKLIEAQGDARARSAALNPNGLTSSDVEAGVGASSTAGSMQALMFKMGAIGADGQIDMARTQAFLKMFEYNAQAVAEISDKFQQEAMKIPLQAQAMAELFEKGKNALEGPLDTFSFAAEKWLSSVTGGLINIHRSSRIPTPEEIGNAKGSKPEKLKGTTINIKIVQTIENANDPDRVLVKTKEALESILRHPIAAPSGKFATIHR